MSLAILCPGQGDQSSAMFDILADEPEAEPVLALCAAQLGRDPRHFSTAELQSNAIAQPAICALHLAAWQCLRRHLPEIRLFAGYSLGEWSAYGCAGAIDGGSLLRLAGQRALAMAEACARPAGLLAVRGLTRQKLELECRDRPVEIAIVNDRDRLVIGGGQADLAALTPALLARGAKLTPLPIAIPSHTSLMRAAVARFADQLEASSLTAPTVPVLAGIDARPVHSRSMAIDRLSRQLAEPLNWAGCMDALVERGCTTALELGPGDGLSRMLRDRQPMIAVRSLAEFHSLSGALDWVRNQ